MIWLVIGVACALFLVVSWFVRLWLLANPRRCCDDFPSCYCGETM